MSDVLKEHFKILRGDFPKPKDVKTLLTWGAPIKVEKIVNFKIPKEEPEIKLVN